MCEIDAVNKFGSIDKFERLSKFLKYLKEGIEVTFCGRKYILNNEKTFV